MEDFVNVSDSYILKQMRTKRGRRINKLLSDAVKALGIDSSLTMQVARNTFAAITLSRGGSLYVVSNAIGHASTAVTVAMYGKYLKQSEKNEIVVPCGNGKEAVKVRERIIHDYYQQWRKSHQDQKLFNLNLNEYINIRQISMIETVEHASKSYLSTLAVLQLDAILTNARKVKVVPKDILVVGYKIDGTEKEISTGIYIQPRFWSARSQRIVPEYPESRQLNKRLSEFRKEYDAKLSSVKETLSPDIVELVLNNVYFEGVAQNRMISLVDYARMVNINLYNSSRQSYTTYGNKERTNASSSMSCPRDSTSRMIRR